MRSFISFGRKAAGQALGRRSRPPNSPPVSPAAASLTSLPRDWRRGRPAKQPTPPCCDQAGVRPKPDLSAPREASRSSAFDAAVEFLQLLGEASKESLVVSELAGVERLHALDLGQRVHGLVHNADFVDRVAQRGGVLLSSQYVLEALQRSIRRRRDGEVHRAERSPAELGTTAVRKKNPPGEEGAEALEVDPSDLP